MSAPIEYDYDFYVGPLGAMRKLPSVRNEIDTTAAIIGGTHTSLSGAFVRDRFGIKRRWTWTYPMITQRQAQHIEALHHNLIPGPLYLIDPRRPNRLPEQIASGGSIKRSPAGFIPSNTTTCLWRPLTYAPAGADTLPASPLLRGCLEWQLIAPGGAGLELAGYATDGRLDIPVLPDEDIVAGLWACGAPAVTLSGTVTVYDATGTTLLTTALSSTALSLVEWRATTASFTCPPTAAKARLQLSVASDTPVGSIFTTAYQLATPSWEAIPGLTQVCDDPDLGGGWSVGGGGPQVVPDIGPTGYVLPGLHSSALTLIER